MKPQTPEEIKAEIKSWVTGADRYNYNLESQNDFIADEILKISQEHTRQAIKYALEDEEWIPVEKQLPPNKDNVLCWLRDVILMGSYEEGKGWSYFFSDNGKQFDDYWTETMLTHWRPLPSILSRYESIIKELGL